MVGFFFEGAQGRREGLESENGEGGKVNGLGEMGAMG